MIRLQDRDIDIMSDICKVGIMAYSQIQKLHFDTYDACIKRCSRLQKDDYIHGAYYNTPEKVFVLKKAGMKTLADFTGLLYKTPTYDNIYHKIMRAELYSQVKKYSILDWHNEATVKEIDSIFDVSFEYNGQLYLAEIHNEQKTIVLKEKLVKCLTLNPNFNLIVYCKSANIVNNLIEKMNSKGFETDRKYNLIVCEYKKEVVI